MKKLIINLDRLENGGRKKKGICKIILREMILNAHRLAWEGNAANSEWRHYSCRIKDYKIFVATHGGPSYRDDGPTWLRKFIFEITSSGDNLASLEYKVMPAKQMETLVSESGSSAAPWPYLVGLYITDLFNRAELAVKNQKI